MRSPGWAGESRCCWSSSRQAHLGLGYAIALSDLVLAPFMPSNTARSGGTIYPVVKNIPPLMDRRLTRIRARSAPT